MSGKQENSKKDEPLWALKVWHVSTLKNANVPGDRMVSVWGPHHPQGLPTPSWQILTSSQASKNEPVVARNPSRLMDQCVDMPWFHCALSILRLVQSIRWVKSCACYLRPVPSIPVQNNLSENQTKPARCCWAITFPPSVAWRTMSRWIMTNSNHHVHYLHPTHQEVLKPRNWQMHTKGGRMISARKPAGSPGCSLHDIGWQQVLSFRGKCMSHEPIRSHMNIQHPLWFIRRLLWRQTCLIRKKALKTFQVAKKRLKSNGWAQEFFTWLLWYPIF